MVGKVRQSSTCEIVDRMNAKAPLEKQVDHVAADEAGGTGYDGDGPVAQTSSTDFTVFTLK